MARNEELKKAARAGGARAALKRQPAQPKGGFTIALPAEVTTIQPIPFSDLF